MLVQSIILLEDIKTGETINGSVELLTADLEKTIYIKKMIIKIDVIHEDIKKELFNKEMNIQIDLKEWSKESISFSLDYFPIYTNNLLITIQLLDDKDIIIENKKTFQIDLNNQVLGIINHCNNFYGTEPYQLIDVVNNDFFEKTVAILVPEYDNQEIINLDIVYLQIKNIDENKITYVFLKEKHEYIKTINNERIFEEKLIDKIELVIDKNEENYISLVDGFLKINKLIQE